VESDTQNQLPALNQVLEDLKRLACTEDGIEDPYFLCGDFNAASHLDYADSGDTVSWPTSYACINAGLVDTYAEKNPSHLGAWREGRFDAPGITWSCLPNEEPKGIFDRIDFVYANRSRLDSVASSETIDGKTAGCNPWPSDHRAVLSVVSIKV